MGEKEKPAATDRERLATLEKKFSELARRVSRLETQQPDAGQEPRRGVDPISGAG